MKQLKWGRREERGAIRNKEQSRGRGIWEGKR